MGAGEAGHLPGAQQRPPLPEGRVLDEPGAQLGGAVELPQQPVAEGLLRHRAPSIAQPRRLLSLNGRG